MDKPFANRTEAGKALAEALSAYSRTSDVLVLGLARGGVPVAYEVARLLQAELDVLVVRKIPTPYQPELALGAVGPDGVRILNKEIIRALDISSSALQKSTDQALAELEERERRYRRHRPPLEVEGRTVILVDDGVATGASVEVALKAIRKLEPAQLVVAVPVASPDAARRLAPLADEFVALMTPRLFSAVGIWYHSFPQTTDEELADLLERQRESLHPA